MSVAERSRIANDICELKHAGRYDRRSQARGRTAGMLQIEQNRSDPRECYRYIALNDLVVALC